MDGEGISRMGDTGERYHFSEGFIEANKAIMAAFLFFLVVFSVMIVMFLSGEMRSTNLSLPRPNLILGSLLVFSWGFILYVLLLCLRFRDYPPLIVYGDRIEFPPARVWKFKYVTLDRSNLAKIIANTSKDGSVWAMSLVDKDGRKYNISGLHYDVPPIYEKIVALFAEVGIERK